MRRFLNYVESALIYSAVVSTFLMMCLTTADAFARYILNSPIVGAYEITEKYLMVIIVFLGSCYAYRGGAYIRVNFLVDKLPRYLKTTVNYFVQLFCFFLGCLFLIGTTQQALHTLHDGVTLSVLAVPLGPAYLIVPLGLFFLFLLILLDLKNVKSGNSNLTREQDSTSQSV